MIIRVFVAACIVTVGLTSMSVARAQAAGGPTSLLITYRSEPANRPAFRVYLQKDLAPRLAKLKNAGVLGSYQILFNPFTTADTWDAMTILRFTSYGETQRWKRLERLTSMSAPRSRCMPLRKI